MIKLSSQVGVPVKSWERLAHHPTTSNQINPFSGADNSLNQLVTPGRWPDAENVKLLSTPATVSFSVSTPHVIHKCNIWCTRKLGTRSNKIRDLSWKTTDIQITRDITRDNNNRGKPTEWKIMRACGVFVVVFIYTWMVRGSKTNFYGESRVSADKQTG